MAVEILSNEEKITIRSVEQDKDLVTIEKSTVSNGTVFSVKGAIKTNTAAAFSKIIMQQLKEEAVLILDLAEVIYIASAGLRALLNAQQYVDDSDENASMTIRNINDEVRDVFESTGFVNILNIDSE